MARLFMPILIMPVVAGAASALAWGLGPGLGLGGTFGWYDNFYYPGTGVYVYDRFRRPYRWNDSQRRFWQSRPGWNQPGARANWNEFRRDYRAERRDLRGDLRENRRDFRNGEINRDQLSRYGGIERKWFVPSHS